MSHLEFGLVKESEALAWLVERDPNLVLRARNYRWKGGEVDLVFEDALARELVFVEVRARKTNALVDAISSITFPKQRRLAATIERYLSRYRGKASSLRVDVMAWDGVEWKHFKNIGLPVP